MSNKYEEWLIEDLQEKVNFPYEDICRIDQYPFDIAKKVLKRLLVNVCDSQNLASIELGRRKIAEINKEWLIKHLMSVSDECIDYSDEWKYRRLAELIEDVVPELKNIILDVGIRSDNEEVRDAVDDYK